MGISYWNIYYIVTLVGDEKIEKRIIEWADVAFNRFCVLPEPFAVSLDNYKTEDFLVAYPAPALDSQEKLYIRIR